jgi:hypothetical protein
MLWLFGGYGMFAGSILWLIRMASFEFLVGDRCGVGFFLVILSL